MARGHIHFPPSGPMAARRLRSPRAESCRSVPDSTPNFHARSRRRHAARVTRLGFVPLADAAPLLVAEALGLFEALGLNVAVSAEPGWATLRDKLAFGVLDGAHLLGPMAIALGAGLGGVEAEISAACGLGRNGNTLTLKPALAAAVRAEGAAALRGTTLAVVFPFSSHNYLLRHWLAAAGLDPDRDIRLTVVPPPQCPAQLAQGSIDGFCAGEPWGSHAEALGAGRIVLGTGDIWPDHPEKLLAFGAAFARDNREVAVPVTAAVLAAARWLDDPLNTDEAVRILHQRAFPHLARETVAAIFSGPVATARPMQFRAATFPRADQAAWWLRQMQRWGHLPADANHGALLAPWNPSLWRAAAQRLNEPEPALTALEQPA